MDASQPGIVSGANSQDSSSTLIDFLETMYANLPRTFQDIQPYSGLPDLDRFGYQAANILVVSQVRLLFILRTTAPRLTTSSTRPYAWLPSARASRMLRSEKKRSA